MSDKNILVPTVIGIAARDACKQVQIERWDIPKSAEFIADAICRAISENPIVPTPEQEGDLIGYWRTEDRRAGYPTNGARAMAVEWQRRMFLAPEPEVPEEIKDLPLRTGRRTC